MKQQGLLSVVGLVLIFHLTLLQFTNGLLDWEKLVNSARCRTRCLANLEAELPDEIHLLYKVKPLHSLLRACIDYKNCTDCMKPCSQPFVNLHICHSVCEKEPAACQQSCQFLNEITTSRPGRCPSVASAFDTVCVDSCTEDIDCDFGLKCCNNGCGTTCQLPTNQFENMPDVPSLPTIRERPKGNSIELRWSPVHENQSVPVLYVVEARSNIGQHYSQEHVTPWVQEAQTTQTFFILRDVTPGHWYQYRVSAINLHGSKNPSAYTKPFSLSREPRQPTAPQNLSEGDTNIMDARIGVTISWNAPKKTDLPITRYKIFWSKRLKSVEEQLKNMREHRQVLTGDQLEYEIPNLDPDTTYFVQVQAICSYGEAKLKSDRASMYITTFPLPHAALEQGHPSTPLPVVIRPLPTPAAVLGLRVHPTFYQNGLLKANVSWELPEESDEATLDDDQELVAAVDKVLLFWAPQVCIAVDEDDGYAKTMTATVHDEWFVMYDLRFDCHYTVTAQSVSSMGKKGKVTQTNFATPSCSQAKVLGTINPHCPTDVPLLPEAPVNFQHSFLISHANITAKLKWRPPESDSPITGYRVVWGTALEGDAILPELDQSTALTKVLPKNDHMFNIGNLLESKTYVAQIQALSRAGAGQMASVNFHTPMLQVPALDPPYKHNKKDAVTTLTSTSSSSSSPSSSSSILVASHPPQNDEAAIFQASSSVSLHSSPLPPPPQTVVPCRLLFHVIGSAGSSVLWAMLFSVLLAIQ